MIIKKTLVFYWYASNAFLNDLTYPFHLACLGKYSNVFDEAIFMIAVDDYDEDLVFNTEDKILKTIQGNIPIIKFDVIKNNKLCEVNAFNKYILNGNTEDNILEVFFFAHTKGARIINFYPEYCEDYLHWIFSLYFYSLEPDFLYEMEMKIISGYGGNLSSFFGPLCSFTKEGYAFYPGTFYWVNMNNIRNDCKEGKIYIPEIANRAFCENFPMIYKERIEKITSHNNIIKCYDETMSFYNHCDWNSITYFFGENNRYIFEYNKIKENIGQ